MPVARPVICRAGNVALCLTLYGLLELAVDLCHIGEMVLRKNDKFTAPGVSVTGGGSVSTYVFFNFDLQTQLSLSPWSASTHRITRVDRDRKP